MSKPKFVYVTYIRTTPEKLWAALTEPQTIKKFWFGITADSDFKPGSSWALKFEDGRLADSGEILEAVPPKRLVIKWRNEFRSHLREEGWSQCVMELSQEAELTKLTITHSIEKDRSQLIQAVSDGWPRVLSSLKSYLETGSAHGDTRNVSEKAHT